MESNQAGTAYYIWASDNAAYGPVELPVLVNWIKDERVTAGTWIFLERNGVWTRADELPELQMFFSAGPVPASARVKPASAGATQGGIEPSSLRRIKILATLSDSELSALIPFIEAQEFEIFAQVVRVGEHGDAMYLILSGELRARTMVDGQETTLATLGVGDYFGEISLLDEGPRSADVIANTDSVVLKLSAAAFKKLRSESPELALHFMYALSRSAAGKIRLLTKRYRDSIQFYRYAEACE